MKQKKELKPLFGIPEEVANGAKFVVNFQKRTCRVNGELRVSEADKENWRNDYLPIDIIMRGIEKKYQKYKHSVPSERSESHRRSYFKALPEKDLSDEDMMYGEQREVARCYLELTVLIDIIQGNLTWQKEWGSWFWQSPADKDLIILRDWVEPNKGGE